MASDASAPKTVLRVKRLRTDDPVPTLQFARKKRARQETVDDIAAQLSESNLTTTSHNLIWKRVATSLTEVATEKRSSKRSCKYVDATLNRIDPKRQRLALTLEKSTISSSPVAKKRPKNAILDPTSRLIDEKMKQVQEGSATLFSFLDFLQQDERLKHDPHRYLGSTLADGSNVLHLAALWNSVEEARYILLTYPSAVSVNAADASGQRPYQAAQLSGNDQVAEVLAAFGADMDDYVYDVFHLATNEEEEKEATVVELRGGVGYLNEFGELILEALCPEDFGHDSEDEQADDDEDSNAEDYETNDYPEEEDDDDDDSDQDEGFRHNQVYTPHGPNVAISKGGVYKDDGDAEYDAQYGLYNGAGAGTNTQRFYAYDPEYDDDNGDE